MKPSVTDTSNGDGFLLGVVSPVNFVKSKAFPLAVKRLQTLGFTEEEAKELLGGSDV